MWTVFLILMLVASIGLLFYILIELNEAEKKVITLSDSIRKHYESE
jgi:nitric oxide reductase large subunit